MDNSRLFQLALKKIEGLGDKSIKHLIHKIGPPQAIFESTKKELESIGRLRSKSINSILHKTSFNVAEKELTENENHKISFCFYSDKEFPSRLKSAHDSPVLFYYKGKNIFNTQKSVAIVGSRNNSEYGKSVTQELIFNLKRHNCTIVSGLAYGIDILAHREAIYNGLPTWAVIAGGFSHVYPSGHKKYFPEIEADGAVITEYSIDTKPISAYFPARNRIIAGLADATIVIESGLKGGALITADIADSYNREVFAVPGKIYDQTSSGCNQLIKNHKANILTSVADLEYIMNWDFNDNGKSVRKVIDKNLISQNEFKVLGILKNKAMHIDQISSKCGMQISILSSILLNLEFQGFVETSPGKIFKITAGVFIDEK